MSRHVVWNEHSLLYQNELMHTDYYGVLASHVHKGGCEPRNGIVIPPKHELRPATIEDFNTFRVCHKGHLT